MPDQRHRLWTNNYHWSDQQFQNIQIHQLDFDSHSYLNLDAYRRSFDEHDHFVSKMLPHVIQILDFH